MASEQYESRSVNFTTGKHSTFAGLSFGDAHRPSENTVTGVMTSTQTISPKSIYKQLSSQLRSYDLAAQTFT